MQFSAVDLLSYIRKALRSQLMQTHIKTLMALLRSGDAPLQCGRKCIAFSLSKFLVKGLLA